MTPNRWSPDPVGPGRAASGASPDGPDVPATRADDAALARALLDLTLALADASRRDAVPRRLAEGAMALLAADAAALCTRAPEGDVLCLAAGAGRLAGRTGELLPLDGSLAGRALRTRQPQRSDDALADGRVYRAVREGDDAVGPLLAVPLLREGRAPGVLLVGRAPGAAAFTAGDADHLRPLADAGAAALETLRALDPARRSREEIAAWRREAELREWQVAYEALAASDRKVVFELDVETDALRWGATLEPVLGLTPEAMGTTLAAWLARFHADDRGGVAAAVEAARGGEPGRVEARLERGDGAYLPVVVRLGGAVEYGAARRLVGAIDDTSAPEHRFGERERAAREAAARDVVRGLRHEINNPLAVVMGQAQLLQRDRVITQDPLLRESVGALYAEAERIQDMLRRLASFEQAPREPFLTPSGGLNLPPADE